MGAGKAVVSVPNLATEVIRVTTSVKAEFDQVRKRIDQQGIIFKVRVFGERVREAESRPLVRAGIRG